MGLNVIIKKIEKDFKSIYKHLIAQGVWVFLGRIYLMGIAFLSSIILTKYLSVDQYGEYRYLMSIIALVVMFSLPESSQIIIRYIPRKFGSLYSILTLERMKYAIIGSLVFILLGIYSYSEGKSSLSITYFVLAAINPFYQTFSLYDALLQAKIDYKRLNQLYVIKTSIQLFVTLIILYIFNSVYVLILFTIITISIIDYFFYKFINKIYPSENVLKLNILDRFKKEVLILSLVGVLPIISAQLDKILIANYLNYASVGIFTIGFFFGKTINSFFKPFISTINAKLVYLKLKRRHYLIVFFIGTLIGSLLSLYVDFLLIYIYGNNYASSYIYARIVLFSMGLYFVQTIYANQNLFYKKSSLFKVYFTNAFVPIFSMLYMLAIILNFEKSNMILLGMALLYPINLLLSIFLLFILTKVEKRNIK